ncbi:hypothetical protein [Streptomyces luteireticuli]|uniref:hypothetical protein n=1 Tax=Streptomyces luteireticuli TaxID=173858 RepID=UPI00355882B1
MLVHVSAPKSRFTQVPNDVIDNPRLGDSAVRLMLWVLRRPRGAAIPAASEIARRIGLKKSAFMRAKQQLLDEGYLHEWRQQDRDGRWATEQLISDVPLDAEEARAVRDGWSPTAVEPAVGEPRARSVGRPQKKKTGEKTCLPPSQPSRAPAAEPAPAPPQPEHPLAARGARALAAVSHSERRLRLTGRDVRELAPLAGEWLLRGASTNDILDALVNGLPEPVHHPAALIRNRLTRKMPDAPRIRPPRAPEPLLTHPGPSPVEAPDLRAFVHERAAAVRTGIRKASRVAST